jgi:hypothetical protein
MNWKFWKKKVNPIPRPLGEKPWEPLFRYWSFNRNIYFDIYPDHSKEIFCCTLIKLTGVQEGDYTLKIYGYGRTIDEAVKNAWRRWDRYFPDMNYINPFGYDVTDTRDILRENCLTLPVFYDGRTSVTSNALNMTDELRRRLM